MSRATLSRAQQLAAEVQAVNDEIVDTVDQATPEQLQRVTRSERWPAIVVAHHVSEVQRFFAGLLAGLADPASRPMPLRGADVDANNARHAAEFAQVGKEETLAALRANGPALVETIRGLDDAPLARGAIDLEGQELTGEQIITFGVVAHFHEHLDSLRQTLVS